MKRSDYNKNTILATAPCQHCQGVLANKALTKHIHNNFDAAYVGHYRTILSNSKIESLLHLVYDAFTFYLILNQRINKRTKSVISIKIVLIYYIYFPFTHWITKEKQRKAIALHQKQRI